MKRIVVAGGGIVAWSAAAALRRHIPSLEVIVVTSPVPPDSLADRMVCTLPSIAGFHGDLGLIELDTLVRAQSGLRIGTLFEGWSKDRPSYVHAYGNHGATLEGIAFHQLWLRANANGTPGPFDHFSAAAELAREGRIGTGTMPSASIGYGLHLDLERYLGLMRDFALHLGARDEPCRSAQPKLRSEDGFIEALVLDGDRDISADLFVDCTGPSASLRSALDPSFEDWSSYLPCDRIAFDFDDGDRDPRILDRVTAGSAGWRWVASTPSGTSSGMVYSSRYEVEGELPAGGQIQLKQGCRAEPWVRNCVAIGDSAVTVEPLEWTNLHLAHSQIDRLVSMMPGPDCAPVELREYNRQCSDEARRVRDFLCMHYVTARREEPFWKDSAKRALPRSLEHSLSLFAERGRLPYYEEETFSRDSWVAVLLGQGFEPRRTDPLADLLSLEQVKSELARQSEMIRSFVAAQPSYLDYLTNPRQRGAQ
jgi:tryptophan halogenase